MDLPPSFFKSAAMKRNLSQHWHKDPGCKFQPLLNIELDHVVVGEPHCLLRVTDRLQEGVINACVWWDTVSCIITKQLNPGNSNYQGKSMELVQIRRSRIMEDVFKLYDDRTICDSVLGDGWCRIHSQLSGRSWIVT